MAHIARAYQLRQQIRTTCKCIDSYALDTLNIAYPYPLSCNLRTLDTMWPSLDCIGDYWQIASPSSGSRYADSPEHKLAKAKEGSERVLRGGATCRVGRCEQQGRRRKNEHVAPDGGGARRSEERPSSSRHNRDHVADAGTRLWLGGSGPARRCLRTRPLWIMARQILHMRFIKEDTLDIQIQRV